MSALPGFPVRPSIFCDFSAEEAMTHLIKLKTWASTDQQQRGPRRLEEGLLFINRIHFPGALWQRRNKRALPQYIYPPPTKCLDAHLGHIGKEVQSSFLLILILVCISWRRRVL